MLATYLLLPEDIAALVADHGAAQRALSGKRRGFGSVRVEARIGASIWQTALFRQKDGTWFLPVKAEIRRAEVLALGDLVSAEMRLL